MRSRLWGKRRELGCASWRNCSPRSFARFDTYRQGPGTSVPAEGTWFVRQGTGKNEPGGLSTKDSVKSKLGTVIGSGLARWSQGYPPGCCFAARERGRRPIRAEPLWLLLPSIPTPERPVALPAAQFLD